MEIVDEKIITLDKPIEMGGAKYDTLALREPTAGELEKASKADTPIGVVINLINIMTKVPRGVIEKLPQRKLKECSDFLESFSADSPAITETLSQS